MKDRAKTTAIGAAAEQLRALVLASADGALIGGEEALIARLGCSRNTVRQVARMLESEGFLRVRRGINGGYFGSRPDVRTIEAAVSGYLLAQQVDADDMTRVGSALWIEGMRKAAEVDPAIMLPVVERWRARIKKVKDSATFNEVRRLELENQAEILKVSKSTYMMLVFELNIAFSRRVYHGAVPDNTSEAHRSFVREWRESKLLELNAIAIGDAELAAAAASQSRRIWHKRILKRYESVF